MCHLQALPGCPKNTLPVSKIAEAALTEADIYLNAGVDGIMIENMHDLPYVKGRDIGPEITAAMAAVAAKLRSFYPDTPIGIQVLTAGNKEALAIAKCAGLDFIRCEGFVFSHIGDEGWIDAAAGNLLRYQKSIAAERVLIFSDIKKKHSSHHVTSDVTIAECAQAAEFFLSDGVIVTGSATGRSPEKSDLEATKAAVKLPVLVGSGITSENLSYFAQNASGLIIGSYFKNEGHWKNSIDESRVKKIMNRIKNV